MERRKKIVLSFIISLNVLGLGLFAWAPWITEEYAYKKVMDHLGGPDVSYNYLGETMAVKDIPKTFVKVPFGSLVYFPGEAVYIVTFLGMVL